MSNRFSVVQTILGFLIVLTLAISAVAVALNVKQTPAGIQTSDCSAFTARQELEGNRAPWWWNIH